MSGKIKTEAANQEAPKGERIAKAMAAAGLCSRRMAEEWILAGRVKVNGTVLKTPACVVTAADKILVDNKPIARETPAQVWLMNKPRGVLTTHNDPQDRPTVFSTLPKGMPRVVSVGRLDMDSEGLILLTNSGTISHYLEAPQTGWIRTYRVRVHGRVELEQLESLKNGITIEGISYKPMEVTLDIQKATNAWVQFKITEGKNREIRRICEHFGWLVSRLIRTSFGPFSLDELKSGEVKIVPIRILKSSLPKQIYPC